MFSKISCFKSAAVKSSSRRFVSEQEMNGTIKIAPIIHSPTSISFHIINEISIGADIPHNRYIITVHPLYRCIFSVGYNDIPRQVHLFLNC